MCNINIFIDDYDDERSYRINMPEMKIMTFPFETRQVLKCKEAFFEAYTPIENDSFIDIKAQSLVVIGRGLSQAESLCMSSCFICLVLKTNAW